MANAWYPVYKQNLLAGTSGYDLDNDTSNDGPYCALVDTGTYTYNAADTVYNAGTGSDVESANQGTDQRITTPTVTNGTFDGDNLTYTAVTGSSIEALVIYRHNAGADTTWPLVLYLDTSVTGLPVTPNGGNITVTWNASGISTISDRRLKDNVHQIGEIGVLPIYSFNYVWDETARVGLMAQDVEKVCPEAVIVAFDKYKAVNYDRAIEEGLRQAA